MRPYETLTPATYSIIHYQLSIVNYQLSTISPAFTIFNVVSARGLRALSITEPIIHHASLYTGTA